MFALRGHGWKRPFKGLEDGDKKARYSREEFLFPDGAVIGSVTSGCRKKMYDGARSRGCHGVAPLLPLIRHVPARIKELQVSLANFSSLPFTVHLNWLTVRTRQKIRRSRTQGAASCLGHRTQTESKAIIPATLVGDGHVQRGESDSPTA